MTRDETNWWRRWPRRSPWSSTSWNDANIGLINDNLVYAQSVPNTHKEVAEVAADIQSEADDG